MNAIDIFYYLGILYIINNIVAFFQQKNDIKKFNETVNNANEGIESASIGDIHSANNSIKKVFNKKFDMFIALSIIVWEIVGIIISDQKPLFILMFCMMIIFPFIIMKLPDNKKKIVGNIDNIINMFIVSLILYNHFLK